MKCVAIENVARGSALAPRAISPTVCSTDIVLRPTTMRATPPRPGASWYASATQFSLSMIAGAADARCVVGGGLQRTSRSDGGSVGVTWRVSSVPPIQ